MTWKNQPVTAQGKQYTLGDIHGGKLYHGSPHNIEGTTITPQKGKNFPQSPENEICFTSDYPTAVYWAKKATGNMKAQVYVYEVEPASTPVTVHRVMLANSGNNINLLEGRAPAATILRKHTIPATT